MNLYLLRVLQGVAIGIANIIPGVSGGSMAVVLNVYDKIISSISNLRKDFINSCKTLIPIGIGGVCGIILFANIIKYTLSNFPLVTNIVFMLLIASSLPMIYKKIVSPENNSQIGMFGVISFIATLAIMLVMEFSSDLSENANTVIYTTLTVKSFAILFFCSILSAGTMIIPGISGSFVMLLLGIYQTILTAIADFNVVLLIPVALGCVVGILLFARVVDVLFSNFENETYCGIMGLMVGSLIAMAI